MESGLQSSFIPQDAAKQTPVPTGRVGGSGLSDLFLLLSIVMFVASAALAGGVFLYEQYVETSAKSKIDQLDRAQKSFEPTLVQKLIRLDDRMHAADQILGSHIAPTTFFSALEQSTLQTVSFQSLSFDATDLQHITIKMQGLARSVNAIALQGDLFSKSGIITSPIFSDISRQSTGVQFKLDALVNPAAINFVHNIGSMQASQDQNTEEASPFNGQGAQQQPQGQQSPQTGQQQGLPGSSTTDQ